ncbi:hypothetical protein I5M27_06630 [Adhaeribacter sp. BT258]|uniref:Uncharacterized protein n=1 Tax=Adhaeribacter terrigena TaxID=2793070 RepID=A0ABS1C009_9BACT|nr:hypothetical protein [Adhaeribacter terrigena]MBK0402653.1 hypothetical protein [Adhaeribacter terrigena]
MKRFLLQIVICITFFNIAGGYTFAAGVLSQTAHSLSSPDTHLSEGFVVKKNSGIDVQAPQINKVESDEDDSFVTLQLSFGHDNTFYAFIPDFRLFNKHFLVHYGKAIKSSLPAIFLVNSVFRL